MVDVYYNDQFKEKVSKIKDKSIKLKIIKQVEKIKENPEVGKPQRNVRKGTRELYIKPFRLSYIFEKGYVVMLDFYHKDEQ